MILQFLFGQINNTFFTMRPCMLSRFSRVHLFVTWTIACQAPLSMVFSRQEYWSGGCQALPPGDLPGPGIKPLSLKSLTSPALAGRFFTTSATWEAPNIRNINKI